MTNLSDPDEFQDLEQAAHTLAGRIRRLKEAVRSLSVLSREVAGLQEALAGLSPETLEGSAEAPVELGPFAPNAPPTKQVSDPAPPVALAMPVANGAHNGSANGAGHPVDNRAEPPSRAPSQPHRTQPNLAVTVSTQGGSVDLVRLYRALQRMPQIVELNLTSYSGGRAVVGLTTPVRPRELPIEEALHDAFPEGIVCDWIGDAEFVAVIAASGLGSARGG